MTGLLTAASENVNINVFILDNGTVAMTGAQETLVTGEALVRLVEGLGVDPAHIRVLNPLPRHRDENVRTIREEVEFEGLSVLIPQRSCVQSRRPPEGLQ